MQIVDKNVVGRIEWDEQTNGRIPLLIIDGKAYSWDEFGEILMGNEGFQFKLEIFDLTDDVE